MANENGESATETAVEAQPEKVVTTEADLTQFFAPQPDGEAPETVEQTEADDNKSEDKSKPEKGKPTSDGESEEPKEGTETDQEGEIEKAEDESDENVLSKYDENIRNLRRQSDKKGKRIDKLTSRAKTAEERLEALEAERDQWKQKATDLEEIASPSADGPKTYSQKVMETQSFDELDSLEDEIDRIQDKGDEIMDLFDDDDPSIQVDDNGIKYIENNGQKITKAKTREVQRDLRQARKFLDQKDAMLNKRVQNDGLAVQHYTFIKDEKSEDYKALAEIMAQPDLNQVLTNRSDGLVLGGAMVEGLKLLKERINSKKSKEGEGENTKTPEKEEKEIKTPNIAPNVPGLRSSVAPARVTSDEKKDKAKQEIRNKNKLTENELAQFFS